MTKATFIKSYDKDLKIYLDLVYEIRKDSSIVNKDILIKRIAKRLKIKQINEVY